MRFKLILEVDKKSFGNILPINYQYEQSALIYRILSRANADYATWLHTNGFSEAGSGKRFKLFTFSRLQIERFQIFRESERLAILSDRVYWYISFLPEQSTENFIQGLFANQVFEIGDVKSTVRFKVINVEVLPSPEFSDEMKFNTLSPVCVRNKRDDGSTEYLRPDNPLYEKALLDSLMSRYKVIYRRSYNGDSFLKLKLLSDPRSVLITIKAGTDRQTQVRGYMYQFKINTPPDLIRIIYESGLGEECSQGFGCMEVIDLQRKRRK